MNFDLPTNPDGNFYSIPETNELMDRMSEAVTEEIAQTAALTKNEVFHVLGTLANNKTATITVPNGYHGLLWVSQNANGVTRHGLYGLGCHPSNKNTFCTPFAAQTGLTVTAGSTNNKVTLANATGYESTIIIISNVALSMTIS